MRRKIIFIGLLLGILIARAYSDTGGFDFGDPEKTTPAKVSDTNEIGEDFYKIEPLISDRLTFSLYFINNAWVWTGVGYFFTENLFSGVNIGCFGRTSSNPPNIYFMSIELEGGACFIGNKGWEKPYYGVRGAIGVAAKFTFPLSYIPPTYAKFHIEPGLFIGMDGGFIPLLFRFSFYYDIYAKSSDFSFGIGLRT